MSSGPGHPDRNPRRRRRLAALAVCAFLAAPGLGAQQIPGLETRIQSALAALARLDGQARSCLDSGNNGDNSTQAAACTAFAQAIDGELLADYLAHCRVLKDRREAFVTGAGVLAEDAAADVEILRGIELACGEDALQKRTEYVAGAFRLLQGGQSAAITALNRRMTEQEQQRTLEAERRLLRNSMREQQQYRDRDIQRQWDYLREQLIRTEINKPPFPGN